MNKELEFESKEHEVFIKGNCSTFHGEELCHTKEGSPYARSCRPCVEIAEFKVQGRLRCRKHFDKWMKKKVKQLSQKT